MTLREHISPQQAWAHDVLDDVRDGFHQSARDIRRALQILGEPVSE